MNLLKFMNLVYLRKLLICVLTRDLLNVGDNRLKSLCC